MKRTSRKPSNLSNSLQRHLNAYAIAASAAGVGILALAQPVEAIIIYTPANIKIERNGGLELDLNNDGRTDFRLYDTTFSGNGYDSSRLGLGGDLRKNEIVEGVGYGHRAGAAALQSGKIVGPHDPFINAAQMAKRSHDTFFDSWANGGKGVTRRYLGLKFQIYGQTHYGWARLSVHFEVGGLEAHLTGYAYETIPGKPIITGKTKGPDVITLEPGSLGALAAGRR